MERPHENKQLAPDAENISERRHLLPRIVLATLACVALNPNETGTAESSNTFTPAHSEAAKAPVLVLPAPKKKHEKDEPKPQPKCTTIRRRPKEIILGTACSDNAKAALVDRSIPLDKGWKYRAISVNGIYKCGFIQGGNIPTFKPRARAIQHCKEYYEPLTLKRTYNFKNFNCPEVLPRVEGCRDGTFFSRVLERCSDSHIYENFATDKPSPTNVFGTGEGGFSDQVEGEHTSVHYRAEVNQSSQAGKAIVVRGKAWGFMHDECVSQKQKRGGPASLLSPGQVQAVNAQPEARETYNKLKDQ